MIRARVLRFLTRDSIYAIARYMLSPSVFLSVRPSVTWVDRSKTVEVRIMRPSPQSSPMTLVSSWLTSPRNSKGNTGSGGAEWQRGRKNTLDFQPISRVDISKTVLDIRPKLLLMANRKLHMRFLFSLFCLFARLVNISSASLFREVRLVDGINHWATVSLSILGITIVSGTNVKKFQLLSFFCRQQYNTIIQ